jgi:hypothetical protein
LLRLRYTDAIVNTLKLATKPSPYYTPQLVAQVKALSDRLTAAPGHDKAGSWITRMVPRGPTKETLWSTLEGGFTKFVAGEGELSAKALVAKAEVAKAANGGPIGPFSHYSSISPGSTSGTLSRTQSQSDLNVSMPPSRPASSAAATPPTAHQQAPGPPPVKRAPFKTHHSRSSSLGIAGYNYDPNAPPPWQSYVAPASQARLEPEQLEATPRVSAQEFSASQQQQQRQGQQQSYGYGSSAYGWTGDEQANGAAAAESAPAWWGSEAGAGDLSSLRAPIFSAVEQDFAEDESGFISPMAQFTPSVSPAPSTRPSSYHTQQTHKRTTTLDELEDLGIGNSKSRKPTFDSIDEQAGEGEEGVVTPTDANTPQRPDASKLAKPEDGPCELAPRLALVDELSNALACCPLQRSNRLSLAPGSAVGSSERRPP